MRLESRLFFARRPVVINMRSRAQIYVTNGDSWSEVDCSHLAVQNDVVALMALLEIKAQTLSVIKNVIIESIFEF